MFEVFSALIIQAMAKLLNEAANTMPDEVSQRRTIFMRFFGLFTSLLALELAAKEAHQLLQGIAEGKKKFVKVMVQKKLDEVPKAADAFVEAFSAANRTFGVAEENLYVTFYGRKSKQSRNAEILNFLTIASPTLWGADGQASKVLSYPTRLPQPEWFETQYPDLDLEAVQAQVKRTRLETLERLNKQAVDVTDGAALSEALAGVDDYLAKVERTRRGLAAFIKQNFPLSDMVG